LCARWELDDGQRRSLAALLGILAEDDHAPSAVREPERAVDVHIADSLAALEVPAVREAAFIADIGAGAGFPGLVLAAALPEARVTLVESVVRKTEFIERAAAAAGLANVGVAAVRAEEWPEGLGRCDVVTVRALASLVVVCEYAAPLLRLGGSLVAWGGRRDQEAEEAADRAADQLGLGSGDVVRSEAYPGGDDHHLHVYLKLRDTPSRFPRRPGMARKRPLEGSGSR
jgi:16S rRNA (guanine527-N7)-methyltransferase